MNEWDFLQHLLKTADADSMALPDAGQGSAALAPMPMLAVGNKPAPGQTGPKGVSPRTSYSRVNSGSPPPADLGSSTQKGLPTDPQSLLPPKVAHKEVPMSATAHYTIQDMIKAAAAGAHDQTVVSLEAARQLANAGEATPSTKLASAIPQLESIPTNYVEKLAAAVDFIVKSAEEPGPGTGPNALQVLEATSSNNEIEAGKGGTATSPHVPPQNPGLQRPSETPHGPANALEDNASMMHPAIPVKLSSAGIAALRKTAFDFKALAARGSKSAKGAAGFVGDVGKNLAKGVAANPKTVATAGIGGMAAGAALQRGHDKKKKASVTVDELRKVAKFPLNEGANKDDAAREPKAEQRAEKKLEEKERRAGGGEGEKEAAAYMEEVLKIASKGAEYGKELHEHIKAKGSVKGGLASYNEKHKSKEASGVDSRLVDLYLDFMKQAEDAINPAKISAGAAVPPETSMAGEAGGAPAGGLPEGPRGLVGSNESAINYQKREAKAPVKAQLAKVLTEPALSAAHDHTLDQAFDHTGQAGVKISSAVSSSVRAIAARALLEKLASEACATNTKAKSKVSTGMGSFQAPPVGGVGSAGASM